MKNEVKTNNFFDEREQFRLLFEISFDGILIGLSDGTITAANPSACKMFGLSEEEICREGRNILVDPEGPRVPPLLEEQTRAGRAQGEILFLKKNGVKFSAEVSLSEFEDKSGCKKVVFIIRDITERKRSDTERKQSDEAMRKLNQRIDTILASITDVYVAYDKEGRFTDMNEQAEIAIGKKKDEAMGKYVWEVFPQDMDSDYMQQNRAAMASQKPIFYESLSIYGRYYEVRSYPSESGLSIYGRDITERKLAEKQLKQKTENLEEVNAALKVLLKQLEDGRSELEGKILSNIRELVLPHIAKLESSNLSSRQLSLLGIAKTNLSNISSSFLQQLKLKHHNLTPREIEVATLVKEGKCIKDISELLSISIDTVKFHRVSLRKKLGLKDAGSNLRSHLLSLQ